MRLRVAPQEQAKTQERRGSLGGLTSLMWANLPFALCFAVLEVALPALVVTQLGVSPAWSAGMFVGNTVLVIAFGVPVVIWLSKLPRRTVFAASGAVLALSYLGFWAGANLGGTTGAAAVALVCVLYTMGEILYTGSGTALVIASAPANLLGRALVRWQLSTGVGMAIAPAVLMGLLTVGPWALWGALALTTLAASAVVMRQPAALGRTDHGDQGVLGAAHRRHAEVTP